VLCKHADIERRRLQRVGDLLAEPATGSPKKGLEQTLSTAEVIVDRGVADSDLARDHLHTHGVGTASDQLAFRGVEDLLARTLRRPPDAGLLSSWCQ